MFEAMCMVQDNFTRARTIQIMVDGRVEVEVREATQAWFQDWRSRVELGRAVSWFGQKFE